MTERNALRLLGAAVATTLVMAGLLLAQVGDDPAALANHILTTTGVSGGLVVHVDCGDGRLTAALHAHEGLLVHGLARAQRDVEEARAYVKGRGLYGPVSVDRWDGEHLPYADNLVNLLVAEDLGELRMQEVRRVLAPNGVAYTKIGGQWAKNVKPRPGNLDEWTHFLHDASGNPVAHDTAVGPPRRLQWVGSPRWARHHDHMASMTSLVSANGRLFYILDEGPAASIMLPPKWRLIARDAFNGAVLWKREVENWNTHQWPLKSGPAHLTRRLVAVGDRVYVTLSLEAPVTALDAATGETLLTYEGSDRAREILVCDGMLLALVDPERSKLLEWRRRDTYVWDNTRRANRDWAWDRQTRLIMAYDAASGRPSWQTEAPVAPCSLAADTARVIFYDGERVQCLDRARGETLWQSEPLKANMPVHTSTGPRTLLHKEVVLFAGNTGTMTALSAADGRKLWESKKHPSGHQSLKDLFVVGGLVWSGAIANGRDSGVFTGRDPLTGEVKEEFPPDVEIYWFHHRCYPAKGTDRYLLTSRTGIEFIDPKTKHWETHHWVRGGCIYGILPCNGMVYAPMHSCGCYLESKLNGFNALAPGPVPQPDPAALSDEARLERGPAYGTPTDLAVAPDDWPTYRHDPARSGSTPDSVSVELRQAWQARLGGRLSSPVIAGGRLLVASVDTHTLHCLDADTGQSRWSRSVGGRIDSPPTVHRGLVLFGSADGYVYALRMTDGELAWRYRAAPMDRRIVAFEQVESTWPVHGSVLVHDGVLYCTAGRSIFLDGGIRLLRLDPVTGRKLSEVVMDESDPETGKNMQVHVKGLNMPVALSDVLSCDGDYLYMRSQKMDLKGNRLEIPVESVDLQPAEGSHLFCQIGFLDDSWFHRSFWTFGRRVTGGYGGWFQAARRVPAGRILVFDDERVYGYGRKPQYVVNASVLEYHLFGADKQVSPEAIERVRRANGKMNARLDKNSANASDWKLRRAFPVEDLTAAHYRWTFDQPSVQVRAMVAAADRLFVAGYPDFIDERRALRLPDDPDVQQRLRRQAEALDDRYGGRLWVVSKADGRPLARYRLESQPVFDGMAAARGRLFISTLDGSVLCLGSEGLAALTRVDEAEALQVISDEPEEPDYLKPPEVDKSGDFARVVGCRVVQSKLGYRLNPRSADQVALALRKLETPLTGQATLTCKLMVPGIQGFLRNGFIAFGDGVADEQLVKCGVRFQLQKALIVQGSLKDGIKSDSADVDAPVGKVMDLTVKLDLEQRTVTLTVNGVTLATKLVAPLKAVTHVGFCTDNAIADFSPLQIAGK
ncbi:MAG: PQQ-binding-like beta-propeller repeat protein [Armatimonadota bacterium]